VSQRFLHLFKNAVILSVSEGSMYFARSVKIESWLKLLPIKLAAV
jgi:hypothetical protein